jgi:hypothetical protein
MAGVWRRSRGVVARPTSFEIAAFTGGFLVTPNSHLAAHFIRATLAKQLGLGRNRQPAAAPELSAPARLPGVSGGQAV